MNLVCVRTMSSAQKSDNIFFLIFRIIGGELIGQKK